MKNKKLLLPLVLILAGTLIASIYFLSVAPLDLKIEPAGVNVSVFSDELKPFSLYEPDQILHSAEIFAGSPRAKVPEDAELLAAFEFFDSGGRTVRAELLRAEDVFFAAVGNKSYTADTQKAREFFNEVAADAYTFFAPPIGQFAVDERKIQPVCDAGEYFYRDITGEYQAGTVDSCLLTGENVMTETYEIPLFESAVDAEVSLHVTDFDGNIVFRGSRQEAEWFILAPKSDYTVYATVEFEHDLYRGRAVYILPISTPSLPVAFEVGGVRKPGEILLLSAEHVSDGPPTVKSDFGVVPKFFETRPGFWLGLLPVNYHTAPGSYKLTLAADGESREFIVKIESKEFQVQHLTVDAGTSEQTIYSQNANAEFENTVGPLRSVADPKSYIDGAFIYPTNADKVTTEFGSIRYTNGSSVSSRHGGTDFANPTGTPVYASNSGRVLFAGELILTGNTLIVEHGYGLQTWHYHMNSLDVKTGEMIVKGQKVGEVGSTGFSTGPHLHFAMAVGGVFVNPRTPITGEGMDLILLPAEQASE